MSKCDLESLANYYKILGNATRLCILCSLYGNEKLNVSDLVCCSKKTQSYVSQELSKLKAWKVVSCEKIGCEIYYTLIDKNISNILNKTCKGD